MTSMISRKIIQPSVLSTCLKYSEKPRSNLNSTMAGVASEKYDEAIATLNTLQANASAIKEVVNTIKTTKSSKSNNVEIIRMYLERCNINLDELSKRVIHVSGTKGKGSTCALTESILRHHGFSTGFFSSPHLFSVTERIRLNGRPISRQSFTSYFWDIYLKLDNNKMYPNDMPGYFKFLTILAYYIFLKEKVDVAIIEVGIGGEYDCTNVIQNTPVVGITSLGFDHVGMLGNTIESIAWMKAGIMKKGCVAFTCSDQYPEALEVLKSRAHERECHLNIIDRDLPEFQNCNPTYALNASLAIHLAHSWMDLQQTELTTTSIQGDYAINGNTIPEKTIDAIKNSVWCGRFHTLPKGNITFYLDGAHTAESIAYCSQWFQDVHSKLNTEKKKILLFNLTSWRKPYPLLQILLKCQFYKAFFCPNIRSEETPVPNDLNKTGDTITCLLQKSQAIQQEWNNLNGCESEVISSVDGALRRIQKISEEESISPSVLVTGSVHLVGNVLSLIEPDLWEEA